MVLVDTNVVSEARKGARAHQGVRDFFARAHAAGTPLFLSAVTVGELRRGVELLRHRNDLAQARLVERWLERLIDDYADHVLSVDADVAQLWGRLCVPHPENAIDKQIAATALIHDLTLATRNVAHFSAPGLRLMNPFELVER